MKNKNAVLITGASSGLGKATASLLAAAGYRVFGTSRQPVPEQSGGYEMLQLDVRSDDSVSACVGEVIKRAGRIDVLINNAGYELAGAIEETTIAEAQAQFETNFFGVARMVRAVLPHMRKQQSGRIITIGSLAGLIGVPFHGYYSASKHALEGYMESLTYEVRKFNIHASLVEAGFMKTNLGKSAQITVNSLDDYSHIRRRAFTFFEKAFESGEDPAIAAKKIVSIVESRAPNLRYKVGKAAKRLPRLKAILPWKMFEAGTRRNFKLDAKA